MPMLKSSAMEDLMDVLFKSGDKVTCAFFGKEVFELTETNSLSQTFVNIEYKGLRFSFYQDGKCSTLHTHPVLKLKKK